MPANRSVVAALAALGLALTATACDDKGTTAAAAASSQASPSPTERVASMTGKRLLDKGREAYGHVSSVRMTGFVVDDEDGGRRTDIQLSADRKGQCAVKVGVGGKGEFELVRTAERTLLVRPTAATLTAMRGAEVAERYRDRWFKVPPGSEYSSMAELCDLTGLTAFGDPNSAWTGLAGDPGTVGDRASMGVMLSSKEEGPYTAHLAAEGAMVPLRLEDGWGESAGKRMTLDFTDYDVPVVLPSLSAGSVVDGDLPKAAA
ncbi:hypothetical protein SAMN05216371_5947 [Streptomyces sp. TLI_053]|uniref:hypothetical protein n=1 Tax=Streptomyces sp. TLI_053 TaxID=1855352 RepID=UPI00087C1BF6|nr:hypothetical protein [Streptomyces sp. TLI_053]SDT79158.1 hypothetical protein SAMN05216371_5947 [Streptomyces sp. TLI_053]